MMQTTRGGNYPPKQENPHRGQFGRVIGENPLDGGHAHYSASRGVKLNFDASKVLPHKQQRLDFAEVRIAAAGRWEGIHRALGIQLTTTSHLKHTPCPGCGGRDRFRLDATYQDSGRWICGGGGDLQSGDGFSLLGHVYGWSPLEQLGAVADHLGLSSMTGRDRAALQLQADKLQRQMQADAQRKHEQARCDSNLLTMLEDMIDAIRYRQYIQRQAGRIVGQFTAQPSTDEVQTAQQVNIAILEGYAHQDGANYD